MENEGVSEKDGFGVQSAILVSHNGPASFVDQSAIKEGVHDLGSPYVKITEEDGKFDSWVVLPLEEFQTIYQNNIEHVRKHLFGGTTVSKVGRKIGVFPCEDCGYVYNWEFNLKRHRKEKHAVILKRVKCPYCLKLFVREDTLIKHIQHVHQQDERCICIHCGADFYRYNSLRRHILTKHRTEKNHRCCLCSKDFSFKWELTIHHQNSHVAEPGYPCDLCKKRFKRPQTLAEHKKFVHDGMRVVCAIDECGEIFNTMANFKKHKMVAHVSEGINKRGPQPAAEKTVSYRIVHAETIEEKLCRHCFQEFPSLHAMRRHVIQEHNVVQKEVSQVVRCTHCTCTFRTKQALKVHITKFHSLTSPQSYSMVKLRDGTQIDDCECTDLDVSVTEELLALQTEAAGPSNA